MKTRQQLEENGLRITARSCRSGDDLVPSYIGYRYQGRIGQKVYGRFDTRTKKYVEKIIPRF